jgi:sigma-B regulation protein RsbU (phosphoserine phosphatase)
VSGKGTSAAFHMSQMKGVFHGLAQLDLSPEEFMIKANKAINSSLDKTSFITISYFVLDQTKKEVKFARAGHCPTLFYEQNKKQASYFTNKGLGLGIVRNDSFANYVQPREFNYSSGDVLILYTDGITEAKNFKGEEYGYDRLADVINKNAAKEAIEIQELIINDVYEFCGHSEIDDDYTAVILKFK